MNGVIPINSLGERIKKLRKDNKMTLAELAGDRLSKGMLSLIENGKAQPSMESLRYIAERVGVEISELLDDGNVEELRTLLAEIEAELKGLYINDLVGDGNKDFLVKIFHKLAQVRGRLQGKNYEEVSLLDWYIRINEILHLAEEKLTLFDVMELYEKIHAFSKVVKCYNYLSGIAFNKNDYSKALQLLQEAEKRIELYKELVDKLTLLDLYYMLTVLYAAIDDAENTQNYLDVALEIAQKNKIYYRINDFYRFIFIQAIGQGDKEKSQYYLKKLKQHAELTEDPIDNSMLSILYSSYANIIEKDYSAVHSYRNYINFEVLCESDVHGIITFYTIEEAYAYWAQGLYSEAIKVSESIKIPGYTHHPLDLSLLYKGFAVRALCFFELGDIEAAKKEIFYAYHGVIDLPNSLYKKFTVDAYELIQNRK